MPRDLVLATTAAFARPAGCGYPAASSMANDARAYLDAVLAERVISADQHQELTALVAEGDDAARARALVVERLGVPPERLAWVSPTATPTVTTSAPTPPAVEEFETLPDLPPEPDPPPPEAGRPGTRPSGRLLVPRGRLEGEPRPQTPAGRAAGPAPPGSVHCLTCDAPRVVNQFGRCGVCGRQLGASYVHSRPLVATWVLTRWIPYLGLGGAITMLVMLVRNLDPVATPPSRLVFLPPVALLVWSMRQLVRAWFMP